LQTRLEFKAQYGGLFDPTKGCHDGIEPYFSWRQRLPSLLPIDDCP